MMKSYCIWTLLLVQLSFGFQLVPRKTVHKQCRAFTRRATEFVSSTRGGGSIFLTGSDSEESDGKIIEDSTPNPDNNNNTSNWSNVAKQAELFWDMAFPYYQESKSGRWLFAGMIGLTLLNSGVSVAFSYLGKDFWNALSQKDAVQFYIILGKYVGALLVGAPVVTLYRFQREQLAVNWREWMTERTLKLYSSSRVYYSLERSREIDNPDQRICEDVRTFTGFSLQLFITIVTSIIDLASFSFILFSIQPQLFVAIFGYAALGTIVTTLLGQQLVALNFARLQKEADFRYALVRLRENAESIAFYAGEDLEGKAIEDRFQNVVNNTRQINVAQRNLEFFTNGYRYLIQILPVSVVAPQYFAGAIELGVISQSVGAFNHILSDLSIIVNQFESLSAFSAGIERLSQFYGQMKSFDASRMDKGGGLLNSTVANNKTSEIYVTKQSTSFLNGNDANDDYGRITLTQMPSWYDPLASFTDRMMASPILTISNLDVCTPDKKRCLIQNLSMSLQEGDNLLIVGNSGTGKSSLLRAIAGLWTSGNGLIVRPADQDVYFLPQRPYCSLGTLRDQLLYPSLDRNDTFLKEHELLSNFHLLRQSPTDQDLLDILITVGLKDLALRAGDGDARKGLEAKLDWSNVLSLGEQQRLAFGRILVNRPRLVILDEATSALDIDSEARMYALLQSMAKKEATTAGDSSKLGLTYISVGHRPSLVPFHDVRLRIGIGNDHDVTLIEKDQVKSPMEKSINF